MLGATVYSGGLGGDLRAGVTQKLHSWRSLSSEPPAGPVVRAYTCPFLNST